MSSDDSPTVTGSEYSDTIEYRGLELSFDLGANPNQTTSLTILAETSGVDGISEAIDVDSIAEAVADTPFEVEHEAQNDRLLHIETDKSDLNSREPVANVLEAVADTAWDNAMYFYAHVAESDAVARVILLAVW